MVWRHEYNAASVHVESASSLSLPYSLSLSFLSYYSSSFFIIFTHIFSLFFFHFFIISIFFFPLFFFSFQQGRTNTILGTEWTYCGCSPISPTLGLLCLTTPKAKCVMSISPSVFHQLEEPSVQLVQFSCFACPSFWKWLVTKYTRGCIETDNMLLLLFV